MKKTTPVVQKAAADELKATVDFITEGRWTEEGWKTGEEKLRRIQKDYHLVMDVKPRMLGGREKKNRYWCLKRVAFEKDC